MNWEEVRLNAIAREFGVSREVILRRLLILGRTDTQFYKDKREEYQKEYESRPKTKGFVPPSTNVVSATGKPFVRTVLDAYHANNITSSDVSDYLGVRLKHLGNISHAVGYD